MMAELLAPLPPADESYELVAMLTPSKAVDLYLGDFTRASRSTDGGSARLYRRHLYHFADLLEAGGPIDVDEITADHCRRYLDQYLHRSPNYQGTIYSILTSFLKWLRKQDRIRENPLDRVPRPRRVRSEDLDVVTIQTSDVPLLFNHCRNWTELLTVAMLAYMGPRRRAAATRRLRHYSREHGMIRFDEKGGKSIAKPVPDEFRALLDRAIDAGAIVNPDDYLIPPQGHLHKAGDRDAQILLRVVSEVAARAGLRCHVHALRAAFATFYLEQDPTRLISLQHLMGHESISTTQIYLRKLDRRQEMEKVRDLRWSVAGGVDTGLAEMAPAATSFERNVSDAAAP